MRAIVFVALALACAPPIAAQAQTEGDAQAGAQAFNACAACHSLTPGRHMTGPSLAHIWEKPAGTVPGFPRYSAALKSSAVTWSFEALNAWLANPRAFIPKSRMTFSGIDDEKVRADLIAFLQAVSEGRMKAQSDGGGMMGGMMGGGASQLLKNLLPGQLVTAIRYCGDTYDVATADGEVLQFWEPNLRFKTDGSADGPEPGKPAIMPSGMLGDRASIIFAAPSEFGVFIQSRC
jgi:cytochrome c